MYKSSFYKLLKKFLRVIRIWIVVIKLVLLIWWDSKYWNYRLGFNKKNKQNRQQIRAKWLTKELLDLGSAFIKIGQLLSARPDVLPSGWVAELTRLQDNVPPFSFEEAKILIQKELGSSQSQISYIQKIPIGAASLAQVHKAKLNNGREVVLKVQRPGLQNLFRLDLDVMQQVAFLVQLNPRWGAGRDWVGVAKECKRVLLRELDFRIEAQYAARFRQQFLEEPNIRVPGVIWELSTEKVLCLDYLPGIKINDLKKLKEEGIKPSIIAEIGASSYFNQLVKFGFFHADPHPGNLAVAKDGALIFYDFGMMGLISEGIRNRIGSMVKSVATQDASKLVGELQAAGLVASDVDLGPIRRFVRVMIDEALTPPFNANLFDKLSGDLYELVYGKPFRLPVELIFVMRALSTFEGVGRSLDPGFNLIAIAKPYLLPLMTENNSSNNDFINEIGRQVGAISSKAVALPKRLDESLEKLEQGDLQLQIRMGESDRQLRRMINAQQSFSQSILLGCLGISSAILGGSKTPSLAILPLSFALPISLGWIKLQLKMSRDARLERLQNKQ